MKRRRGGGRIKGEGKVKEVSSSPTTTPHHHHYHRDHNHKLRLYQHHCPSSHRDSLPSQAAFRFFSWSMLTVVMFAYSAYQQQQLAP
jgi:hypothetical protein